ncbi:hypothetical protein [Haloglomus litoreum]|uniref:DUF7857 domain-containing protein n=1 Tax=Haloglomus litoreum TaxID=3034026 RepID=UPI0023E82E11|nr:hypothetical protein [Haloglomus sp. DT116]
MPTLECEVDRRGGLTLVECIVHNDTTDRRRVRVTNRLAGPVRAPPADTLGPAWTDGTATCTLSPGERAALGYASHAAPRERPVELAHEVVERGDGEVDGGDTEGRAGRRIGATDEGGAAEAPTVPAPQLPDEHRDEADDGEAVRPDGAGIALPPAVAAWLSALERRVEALEDGRRDLSPGHATVVVDRETLSALERRAAELEGRLAAAGGRPSGGS